MKAMLLVAAAIGFAGASPLKTCNDLKQLYKKEGCCGAPIKELAWQLCNWTSQVFNGTACIDVAKSESKPTSPCTAEDKCTGCGSIKHAVQKQSEQADVGKESFEFGSIYMVLAAAMGSPYVMADPPRWVEKNQTTCALKPKSELDPVQVCKEERSLQMTPEDAALAAQLGMVTTDEIECSVRPAPGPMCTPAAGCKCTRWLDSLGQYHDLIDPNRVPCSSKIPWDAMNKTFGLSFEQTNKDLISSNRSNSVWTLDMALPYCSMWTGSYQEFMAEKTATEPGFKPTREWEIYVASKAPLVELSPCL